jgi:Kef-type K+ transport system membrane component KefB
MDLELTLTHVLIVLVAARVAAELADRIHQPAVVIEILTGILIGPSLLGLVGPDNVLIFLGQLGAILLLFEVGMQMDLKGLIRVGGGALRVAGIGVVAPMALALAALFEPEGIGSCGSPCFHRSSRQASFRIRRGARRWGSLACRSRHGA